MFGTDEAFPLPVATDGFFALDAEGDQLSADAAQSSLQVVVTDEDGMPVAGATKLLSTKREGWYLFGWSANAPLAVGAQLKASLSASPVAPPSAANVGGDFSLTVVGEPTALPEPTFELSGWFDFFHGQQGAVVTCVESYEGIGGTCRSPQTISVPASIEKQLGAAAVWSPPPVVGGVAWSARLEAATGESDARVLTSGSIEFWGGVDEDGADDTVGRLVFPTPGAQHCATLVLKDLRTSQERRTEMCSPVQPAQGVDTDTVVARCGEPPSDASKEAWCRLRGGSASEQCATGTGAGTAGSSDGGPVTPSGDGVGGSTTAGDPATTDDARTSKGCQLGGSSSPSSHLAWAVLALSLLVRRRR
jgi:uncharacterized protein (TIGR03382 family)